MAIKPKEQQINDRLSGLRAKMRDNIGEKGGDSSPDTLNGLADAILTIPQGGGGGEGKHRIRFISPVSLLDGSGRDTGDYIIAEYRVDDGGSVTLPEVPPRHDIGLSPDGWTHTQYDLTNITHDIDVGAQYITDDGKTHVYLTVTPVTGGAIPLYWTKGTATELYIDWGDGNGAQTYTGATATSPYGNNYGNYIVKITANGSWSLGGGSSSLVFVGGDAAIRQQSLTKCYIGENVAGITTYAFSNCSSLVSVVIPDNVTSISAGTFFYCHSLASVVIPDSVTSIGDRVFFYCYSLTSIAIPDSVTSIGERAFYSCYSLASVVIPDNVTSISAGTFFYCHSLASVVIPDSVTSIGENTFAYCYSLTSIVIPDNVTSIGSYAFTYCSSLVSVVIPDNVTSIGDRAFSVCPSIKEYIFKSVAPPTLSGTNVFSNINAICKIYAPDESVKAYKTATNWNNYANYIYPISQRP